MNHLKLDINSFPAVNYLFKVNDRNTRTRCEICSKLTMKSPAWHHWRRSAVFIVNLQHISQFVLVSLLLTSSRLIPAGLEYQNRPFKQHWKDIKLYFLGCGKILISQISYQKPAFPVMIYHKSCCLEKEIFSKWKACTVNQFHEK